MSRSTPPTSTGPDFESAAAALRPRLLAHCYRMLGSVQDAEDQVQETYLRAWKAFHSFEGRASLDTWMTTIATRACLNALRDRARRVLPIDLGADADPADGLVESPEVPWLEPLPEPLAPTGSSAPEAEAHARESLRLAFVSALQALTPNQRAVLLLRDVLGFSAAEAAETMEVEETTVNSALQRARAGLRGLPPRSPRAEDLDERERDLLQRYVSAFGAYDTPAVLALLQEDATWEMPPFASWYRGRARIGALIDTYCPAQAPGDLRLVPVRANGAPAAAVYLRGEGGAHHAFQVHVLDVDPTTELVRQVHCFFDASLFSRFSLPDVLT